MLFHPKPTRAGWFLSQILHLGLRTPSWEGLPGLLAANLTKGIKGTGIQHRQGLQESWRGVFDKDME